MTTILFEEDGATSKVIRIETCRKCGGKIIERRSDAKYCSDVCANRYRNAYYRKRHPEKMKAKRKIENDRAVLAILYRIKSRAKRDDILFSLSEEDITIPDVCPILNIPLMRKSGKGYSPNSPSVDRMIPERGYVPDNIRVISARANLLKNNASIGELELVLEDLKSIYRHRL